MDGKLIAFHCFGTPGPVLTDDERAVLQVLKDARGIFAGEGQNGGMDHLLARKMSGLVGYDNEEIYDILESLVAKGRAEKLQNGKWRKA